EDAPYPAITDYIAVPPADYTIDIKDASGTVTVATFTAPLSGLTGGAAFVFASGFLTPSANQDGAGFGIFAALADGTVLELPAITTARLQVIHNAADPAAKMVDVYVNGALLDIFDDFEFRTATPFIDVPANTPITIGVAPGTSSSADDVIATFNATLMAGKTYVAVANGVLDPAKFEANPDGKDTGFTLLINDMARESGTSDDVDFFVVHGITDAPTVDVGVLNGPKILEGLAYGDISEYISVPAGYYEIDLRNSVTNSVVRWFEVELAGLGGGSAVVVASGFINNSGDQKGIGPVLLGVLADGTVVIFPDPPLTTDISDGSISAVPKEYDLDQNYPNPFNPSTEIQFSLPIRSFVSLKVYNMLGQEMANLVNQELSAGVHRVILDAANFESGVYFYRLEADGYKATRKMTLMK
ncbi:DUF4397 domain-containing protein, partial [candidate division KSB1 bacterium]|nr:DUF4397 domain-containing protein [candidate division KSB1 bacterium]